MYRYQIQINGGNDTVDLVLKQKGNKVGVYIDDNLVTIIDNKSVNQSAAWLEKNLKNIKIHI